jgi:hypothetical protein
MLWRPLLPEAVALLLRRLWRPLLWRVRQMLKFDAVATTSSCATLLRRAELMLWRPLLRRLWRPLLRRL